MKDNKIDNFHIFTDKNEEPFNVTTIELEKENDKDSAYKNLLRNMRLCREFYKMTQQDVANKTGLSKNYISAMERGVYKCSAESLISYAHALNVPVSQLVGDDTLDQDLRNILSALNQENLETVRMLALNLLQRQK